MGHIHGHYLLCKHYTFVCYDFAWDHHIKRWVQGYILLIIIIIFFLFPGGAKPLGFLLHIGKGQNFA